jgi:hypothetical protein
MSLIQLQLGSNSKNSENYTKLGTWAYGSLRRWQVWASSNRVRSELMDNYVQIY